MTTVTLNMQDLYTGESISRTIDGSNAMTSGSECWELRGENSQRDSLERWISERGNEQHNTTLELIDWTINK